MIEHSLSVSHLKQEYDSLSASSDSLLPSPADDAVLLALLPFLRDLGRRAVLLLAVDMGVFFQ